jgi:nicotinamide-nucleotide adenylyltransferase
VNLKGIENARQLLAPVQERVSAPTPRPAFLYDLPRLLWLRKVEQQLQRQSEPALHVLRPLSPGTPHPPAPSPSRGEGEQRTSPLPRTGRGAEKEASTSAFGGGEGAFNSIAVLSGSFNPLTRGHEALITTARREGTDAVLIVQPVRAIDKEGVARAALVDRALVLLQWAARHEGVGLALVNRGLYLEQAALLAAPYPSSALTFLVGYDKVEQIFDARYYADRDAALEALFRLATLRVAPRQGRGHDALDALLQRQENRRFAAHVTPLLLEADVDALSSTSVREAARAGDPWETLVPVETAVFLRETLPYSAPVHLPDGEEIDAYGLRLALIEAAATGRLSTGADFAALCRDARAATPEGQRLRAWLAQDR